MELIIELILLGVAATFLTLYLKEKSSKNVLATNTPNNQASAVSTKSEEMVKKAVETANEIIRRAEVESIKTVTEANLGTALFENTYQEKLEETAKLANTTFLQHITTADNSYKAFIDSLQSRAGSLQEKIESYLKSSATTLLSSFEQNLKLIQQQSIDTQTESQNTIKERINEYLLNFEQSLSAFLTNSQQQSSQAINLELKSAHSLIDSYKQQQLQLIDENIIAVLEKTLSLVLRKRLSLKEHMDLVFESLERAKIEKFFV